MSQILIISIMLSEIGHMPKINHMVSFIFAWAFQVALVVKNPPDNAGAASADLRYGFNPWAGKIPWRKKWQSTPACLPGKFHGQRSLGGYSLGFYLNKIVYVTVMFIVPFRGGKRRKG